MLYKIPVDIFLRVKKKSYAIDIKVSFKITFESATSAIIILIVKLKELLPLFNGDYMSE